MSVEKFYRIEHVHRMPDGEEEVIAVDEWQGFEGLHDFINLHVGCSKPSLIRISRYHRVREMNFPDAEAAHDYLENLERK